MLPELARDLADAVFPRACVHCAGAVAQSRFRWLCGSCAERLFAVREPCCMRCGMPFEGIVEGARTCPNCLELKPAFSAGRTLMLFREAGASLVHELKYHQGRYVLEDVRRLCLSTPWLRDWLGEARLVPVPLFPVRERERGYNQSRLLAEVFARAAGGGEVEELLARVKHTRSQTELSKAQRRRNVARAFDLRPGAQVGPRSYVLVDDVFTTGSTLHACARVLTKAGAVQVRVMTLAHG